MEDRINEELYIKKFTEGADAIFAKCPKCKECHYCEIIESDDSEGNRLVCPKCGETFFESEE